MKVWVCQTPWDHDGGAYIVKVFDTEKKAESHKKWRSSLGDKWQKYHEDGTVDRWLEGKQNGSSDDVPECKALLKQIGEEDIWGTSFEVNVMEIELE